MISCLSLSRGSRSASSWPDSGRTEAPYVDLMSRGRRCLTVCCAAMYLGRLRPWMSSLGRLMIGSQGLRGTWRMSDPSRMAVTGGARLEHARRC